MADWRKSAENIVNNYKSKESTVNKTESTPSTNNTPRANDGSGGWKSSARRVLDNMGYIAPITYEIKPTEEDEAAARQKRIDSNPVFKRYNIDPANFDRQQFDEWLDKNNIAEVFSDSGYNTVTYNSKTKGGFLGIGGKRLATQQQVDDAYTLSTFLLNKQRNENSQRDLGGLAASSYGIVDGLSFVGLSALENKAAKADYERHGLDPDLYVSPKQVSDKIKSERPIEYLVGNIAGSTAAMVTLGKAVGVATNAIPWFSKAPKWVQSAINSGVTYAISGSAETASAGGTTEEIIQSGLTNLLGGAVGGAASYGTYKGLSNLLTSPKFELTVINALKDSRTVDALISGLSGSAFALASAGTKYLLLPEDKRPTGKDLARDIGVAFLYGAINSLIMSGKTSNENTSKLKKQADELTKEYEKFQERSIELIKNGVSGDEWNAHIDEMRSHLADIYKFYKSNRFVGATKEVQGILRGAKALLEGPFAIEANTVSSSGSNATSVIPALPGAGGDQETTKAEPPKSVSGETASNTLSNSDSKSLLPTTPTPPVSSNSEASGSVSPAIATKTPTNIKGDLGEVANASPVIEYAPENASREIKRLENILIAKGADDTSREEIVSSSLEIEKTLTGSDKTIRSVFNDISEITTAAIVGIKNEAGASDAYWKLFGENLKALSSGSILNNAKLITEYTSAYVEALKNSNPEKYNAAVISVDGTDLSAELPKTIMQNIIPANVKDAGSYRLVATRIKNIISNVDAQISGQRAEIYGTDHDSKGTSPITDTSAISKSIEQAENFTDSSVKDAQEYNTIVSNLKKKAEALGLLDKDFFTALQNVDLHDLSANDKVLINNEFNRVFSNNTDPLVASWLDSISVDAKPVTSINEQNVPVSADNTSANTDETSTAKGEILSLKHTKNVYSLFKGADKVIIGKDVITDGFVAIPLTDEAIAEINNVASAVTQENPNFELSKFYHKDNSIVIEGNPRIADFQVKNKKEKAYVFKIGDAFYMCKQKYIDAFNNGKNTITANEDLRIPWSVHNENGELVALFTGMNRRINAELFNSLPSVSEVKYADKQRKAENANKPFNQNEVKQLINSGIPFFSEVYGSNYVGNGSIFVKCDETATEFIKIEYSKINSNSNYEIEHKEDLGSRIEHLLSEAKEISKATDPVLYNIANKPANAYVIGDYAVLFNKNYANLIKKRSSDMSIISIDSMDNTLLVGHDANGNITGFVLPIVWEGEVTTKDGKTVPIANKANIKQFIKNVSSGDMGADKNVVKKATKNEDVLKNEPDNAILKNNGTKQIADYVASKLAKGEKITALELSKISSDAFGGSMADNAYSIKDAYDAMELGVNQHILSMKDVSADKMLKLLELLPTQTKRTEDMIKYQQFSTPPSIAYLANYVANINTSDVMLEPSAGIGGIAAFAKKDGATVYVNELDGRRLSILKNLPFNGFFNENAEQLDNILGGQIEPTVIVMNPPFSSSSERNIQNTKIGAKHIEQALKILAPNGRLVAIVGHGMGDGAPAFRNWWKDIKSQYNVRANIRINGKNYNKYGTNFDVQMLVIDKNGATTQTETGYVDTIQELQEKLGGIRDERPAIDYSANEQRTPATTRTEDATTGKTTDVRNGTVSDAGSLANKGKSTNNANLERQPERKGIQSTDADGGKPAINETESTDVMANEDRGLGTGQQSGPVGNQNPAGVGDGDSGQSDIQTRRVEPRKRVKHKELTDSIFEHYQTQPLRLKNTQPHPAKVSESAAMSAIEPPVVTYKPNIPQSVIENGVLSDVQLEAISYAGQSHSQTLPNGNTRGFFLGDGTGIGKGRTIAGMMLDNYNQGRKKSLWVTLNSSLVNDAKRDVKALFGNSDLVTQFVGGNKADSVLGTDEAIMVISYSALSKGFDNSGSNFEKIVRWLGKDFDGLIVFDEAHKMGNATTTKGTRGVKKASQTGLAGIALQEALPKAKVVYSSATGATEVENLRYAERLGLWGDGTSFVTGDDFVSKIKAGGLAAMELIARDMKAMGVYLSRNISYEDVHYDKITHKLTNPQKKIYDELARSWQIVLSNINKALDTTNQSKDGTARGRALGAFWSSQQRFFNQILTSMQVPSVISDIEKQLADGKSCVIQLVSTNEAAQNEEFARLKAEDLELDEFDLTPKQMLMSYIENSFPVQQFEEYRDDEGNVRSKPVYDSKGNPVMNRDAVKHREELLVKLGSIKVPSSPIDMIINHFGTDLVAENTGRARRVIQKDGKFIEEKIGSKKDADVDAFQNGNKRIIIFSKAGGTGKSYHADRAAKNQQQRVHYLLEAGWQADNAVQGFGRSHRSNQASAPIFKLVTTDLKGQMRFISTIAKRLDQLGAMTKGQRQAGGQGMFSASDNLENSFAADVLAVFYKDLIANKVDGIDDGLAIVEKLGLKDKILDGYNRVIVTAPELREVNKFLNRILSLESSEQNIVFDGYSERLQDATEKAMLAGTLDKGLENYKADKITLNEVQDIREDERSGAKTKYYNLTAEHRIKPVRFDDITTASKSFVGFYQNKTTGIVRAVMQTSSTTDQYGNVTNNYKLVGQVKNDYIAQNRFYGNWTKIEPAEAERLWNEELSKLPEFRKESLHLISGVVLPVWDKLPTENVRIYRVLTSDGEMLIGRVVSEDMIDETLRRLGSSRTKEKIATKDLIAGIKNGDTVHLENDWKIIQRKVSGESRIEITGPSYEHYNLLTKNGVFTERIQYSTRYFIPTDTNTEKIIDSILKLSPIMRVENPQYSITKGSAVSEQTGNDLLHGNSGRKHNASTGEQAERISIYKRSLEGKTAAERKNIAKELLEKGLAEEKVDGIHKYSLVKPEAYNADMQAIVAKAKSDGKQVGFFIGEAQRKFDSRRNFRIDAIKLSDNRILLRYDGVYSPQTLLGHEDVHIKWDDPQMQKAKDIILNDLSDAQKKKILSDERYKDYLKLYKGVKEKVWEEFIADVFAGMNDYAESYIDIAADYYHDGKVIDRFSTAEYTESIDAGGNASILDNIGLGDEYSLNESGEKSVNERVERGGTDVISEKPGNKGRRYTGNSGHISSGGAALQNKTTDGIISQKWSSGEGSNTIDMDTSTRSAAKTYEAGREGAVGQRFLEALNNQDEKAARKLLDKKAKSEGYEPVYIYHGTREGVPFDTFSMGAPTWVTEDIEYAETYSTIADKAKPLDYLYTESKSGIFELYVKKGKILDLGNIETVLSTPDEVIEFGKKVGFSKNEILKCWNAGRKYEDNKAWTLTNTEEFADIAREHGYDSLRAIEADGIETFGILYSENLKSAKLRTYDANGEIIPLERRFDNSTDSLRYAISTSEKDTESLTPERKKEILSQFEKDRVGIDKPTQKQLWGERAAWVAHNMARVFPNIPERGEKGTFFAEFRKSMIQWKGLPTTASFMVQDKLNKMTEGLTPEEFKTFSELVYFLDLQEEAQIQKERGYTEILLPNEITPSEVDAIVQELNKEASEKVKQALIKRQYFWDDLKSRYIDLNNYIGFSTDDKFKRKNYYHHQVIEYMSKNSGGTGNREIGIKAGRGWLIERQGSTKAINTDFLAVEYKAMLQMQYDVYIAETLGRIKQQYDIKPQLEDEAFKHNKQVLNDIVVKEATGKDGEIRLDSRGKPDSETYRRQMWYNSRIMFGFSGLFDLAERNELSTYGNEYTNVVAALKRHDLNVPGLYKYVGIIASTDLPDNATDAQEQAVLNARTVLKYTSQKKTWLKSVLGDEYQTWESIAKSMSDTHTIHQPRRGNYFYTKTVIDEDAFNRAHNEIIMSLTSGEVDLGDADLTKLFTQYAETVRLTGAAYEQWVLPNEIVTTMNEIANPKQSSEGIKVARSIVSMWKGWATSVNPLRTVKFGIRNLAGDLDAVIAGRPGITRYSKRAVQEIYQAMRHKQYSSEFMEWIERGGYTSMIFANEMDTEMQDKLFAHLKDKQGISLFKIPAKILEGYFNSVENAHNFREAILRYSAYLYFKDAITSNGGNVKDYVASNKYIVKGLNTVEDKAYQLSKDLLGAYDEVGKMGQTLRRYWVPFYSFTETNLKRYYRMIENIITSDDNIPKKAGKLLLKALMINMLGLLMAAWNNLVKKEEDDKLPPSVRKIPHLTLGQIGDKVYAFRQLGSFSELLEWFGLDDYKWTSEDIAAPADKAWGMITPFFKMPIELISGLNFYPSLSNPRAIRDKWQHFFNSFGVDAVYDEVTGKPTKGAAEILKDAFIYDYDYKESAYYEILDIKRKYQGKTDNTIYGTDSKSNALYYMKTAVRYKDKSAAIKYLDKYFDVGGTVSGIKKSFASLNPMYGYTGKDTIEKGEAFIASLTDEQKDKLKIAQDYYENDLMLPENILSMLGKSGITDEEAKNVLKNYIDAKCKS